MPPWPSFPSSSAQAKALLAARQQAAFGASPLITADELIVRLRQPKADITLGFGAIARRLRSWQEATKGDSYLLFGSYHDSGLQVDAFRRLAFGAQSLARTVVALEQVHADARYPNGAVAGDDGLLRRYLAGGSMAELATSQRRRNYTAWKYGYIESVLDLVQAARAEGARLSGCDMPSSLQQRAPLAQRNGLRDLHCARTLRDRLAEVPSPRHVVAFYGAAHLDTLPRVLPAKSRLGRVVMMGGRVTAESLLTKTLRLAEPLLLNLGGDRWILLLVDPRWRGKVDRVRVTTAELEASGRGKLLLAGQVFELSETSAPINLDALPGHYRIDTKTKLHIGAIDAPLRRIELEPNGIVRLEVLAVPR